MAGLNIGGHDEVPDWPKMGPSLLIATCLIVAIRTAKWPTQFSERTSNADLSQEIAYAAQIAEHVLSHLVAKKPAIFPSRKRSWYTPDGSDCPK